MRGRFKNGALIIESGDKKLIDLSQISGGFEMSSEGVYGALRVKADPVYDIPRVGLSDGTVTVQMNTVDEEKSGDFNLGGATAETLTFGAGPYLRVDVERANLVVKDGDGGELGTLSGDFAFEQSGGVTKVGVNDVTVSVEVSGSAGSLTGGKGSDVGLRKGVAGTASRRV